MATKRISIAGAGLVGSLLGVYLSRRGYEVNIFERRPDFRKKGAYGGRSINLALSNRGLRALREVGLEEAMRSKAIPMHGRQVHPLNGAVGFFPYGKEGEYINSISRSGLNEVLMDAAEQCGVKIHFEARMNYVSISQTEFSWTDRNGKSSTEQTDILIGADGAYSAVRQAMQASDRFDFSQSYIEHGYKELTIPAAEDGNFRLDKNALHIWPRESYMLIALPNPDGSFTCTLFFPFEGPVSFEKLNSDEAITDLFKNFFPDVFEIMPDLLKDFRENPSSSLVTMRCYPWVRTKTMLIGDAAHAIVPFYGQGMNAGFEDCRVLNELLDVFKDDWSLMLPEYQRLRKPAGDAIAQLALNNFIEMRDLVADPDFILQKKIEGRLHSLFPEKWIPLYSMVTFRDDIPYTTALETGRLQQQIMHEVLKTPGIQSTWEQLDFASIVSKLN
ncbi:MAG: FAD-dependent oxidoreductase [Cyclobacteriaceae bacterium]